MLVEMAPVDTFLLMRVPTEMKPVLLLFKVTAFKDGPGVLRIGLVMLRAK